MKTSVSWLGTRYGSQIDHSQGGAAETQEDSEAKVLVVDDEPRMRSSVADLLMAYGHECQLAANGEEALRVLGAGAVDLVLLDLNMPEMDGFQVMRDIQEKYQDTDVIVISGETTFESATEALRSGAQDFLRKPYSPDELIRVVDNLLRKRQLEKNLKEMNRCLEASENRYRFIVNNSPDIIYMLDNEGRFAFLNERAQSLLGYNTEFLLGMHYSQLVHKEDMEKARYVFDERRTGSRASQNIELRLLCRGSELPYRYFESKSITIELSAMGIYTPEQEEREREFVGTYGVARDISERKRAEEVIKFQLYHDLLTKLPNRELFRDRLNLAISQARRNKANLAVMFLDMDRFKVINDSLGHLAGDQLLQTVASRLHSCLRDGDTLARVGGDEFNLLVPGIEGRDAAAMVAKKIIDRLKEPVILDGYEVFVSFSIGIALFPEDGQTIDALIKNADMAMYHIKAHGKNGYEFFSDNMKATFQRQLSLENGIRKAIEKKQFELFFQPQFDIGSGRVCGMEALIRWNHPERGLLLPGQFIPLSEETGLIIEIGNWVLDRCCRELKHWRSAGYDDVTLAINISAAQLVQSEFERSFLDALDKHGIPGGQLEIEITENMLMQDMDQAVNKFQRLAASGVRVAVDDFGIGYSSLSYLHALPLNTLKIDRSFITGIQSPQDRNSIVTAVFAMARELGLEIVAEGVEKQAQLEYLRNLDGCRAQGFFLGHPLPASEAITLLRQNA
ncbi:MAG: EAL domain-containing protein [Gammaproteobacteria bacterium]|nr:EAL domain-containing protein [Gammaproteobacteria bacterium]